MNSIETTSYLTFGSDRRYLRDESLVNVRQIVRRCCANTNYRVMTGRFMEIVGAVGPMNSACGQQHR